MLYARDIPQVYTVPDWERKDLSVDAEALVRESLELVRIVRDMLKTYFGLQFEYLEYRGGSKYYPDTEGDDLETGFSPNGAVVMTAHPPTSVSVACTSAHKRYSQGLDIGYHVRAKQPNQPEYDLSVIARPDEGTLRLRLLQFGLLTRTSQEQNPWDRGLLRESHTVNNTASVYPGFRHIPLPELVPHIKQIRDILSTQLLATRKENQLNHTLTRDQMVAVHGTLKTVDELLGAAKSQQPIASA